MSIYKVQRGDTLYIVAKRHGETLEKLKQDNPNIANIDPRQLEIGTELQVNDTYTATTGDTLTEIAREHNVYVGDLYSWNADALDPKKEGRDLKAGQTIKLEGNLSADANREEIKVAGNNQAQTSAEETASDTNEQEVTASGEGVTGRAENTENSQRPEYESDADIEKRFANVESSGELAQVLQAQIDSRNVQIAYLEQQIATSPATADITGLKERLAELNAERYLLMGKLSNAQLAAKEEETIDLFQVIRESSSKL